MNKLLIALIAGGFATVAAAQPAAPAAAPVTKTEVNKEKAKAVESVTTKESDPTGGPATAAQQKANTAKSKTVAKPTTAQKQADVKAAAKASDQDAGARATAAEQKANTAVSKQVPKEKVNLGTPAAEKDMAKKATP
jgi:hypothetical protein